MTHLALLVQRFYGERIGSDVNDGAQLEPIGGVGRPNWPPILHDSLLVGTTTQLVEGETDRNTDTMRAGKEKSKTCRQKIEAKLHSATLHVNLSSPLLV